MSRVYQRRGDNLVEIMAHGGSNVDQSLVGVEIDSEGYLVADIEAGLSDRTITSLSINDEGLLVANTLGDSDNAAATA